MKNLEQGCAEMRERQYLKAHPPLYPHKCHICGKRVKATRSKRKRYYCKTHGTEIRRAGFRKARKAWYAKHVKAVKLAEREKKFREYCAEVLSKPFEEVTEDDMKLVIERVGKP